MSDIPYVGYGNDQLKAAPALRPGDMVRCPACMGEHPVEESASDDGRMRLGFYRCGEKTYLASIQGKSIMGERPACSGTLGEQT